MNKSIKKYELTHPQKRIWYNEILFSNTPMHNILSKVNMGSDINITLLEKTINLIIEKNDSLRVKLYEDEGIVYQYIDPYKFINIPFIDFSSHNENAEKAFNEFCANEGKKIIYKENELLFKVYIYKVNEENIGVCFLMHHIIIDGTSVNLILKQLGHIYEQLSNGIDLNNKVENSYINFINDEKEYLNSDGFLKNKKFWNDKFSELDENSLYVNPKNIKSKYKNFPLKNHITKKINSFLSENKISLNKFFISIASIYMNNLFSTDDLTLAVATFNRSNEKQRNTVGMFTGTMPLRVHLDYNITYNEFLNNVITELRACYSNQKYPYDLLVQDLKLKKKGFDSLFKCCINYYVFDSYGLKNDSKRKLENEVVFQEYSNIPLQIFVKEFVKSKDIQVEIHYRVHDYTEQEIIAMFSGMEAIIEQIVDNPKMELSQVKIISKEDKNKILKDFNNTKKEYQRDKTIKEIFEETVLMKKEEIAIVSKGKKLSYDILNQKGNQIANTLRKRGIKPNNIVPIICDRSIETIIGILGIIKSGAAYLPIDEEYPEVRVKYMIEDSKSEILLTPKKHLDKLNLGNLNIELIEINSGEVLKEDSGNLKDVNMFNDLAYIIYTSGSTGKPKGVCVENRSILNLVMNPHYIEFGQDDKMLQSGSLSFDASVFQVWFPLLNGVPLYLEDNSFIIDSTLLEKYIEDNKITIMFMPTPLFNQHSRNNIEIFKNLRCVIAGGDVLLSKQLSKLTNTYKNLKVVNGYGPTENTVLSTIYEIKGGWDEDKIVPIGKPILNSTAYIMDRNNNLLPIGAIGELCVGGDGLSRGYLNKDELTKQKFVDNPYRKGEKIYKTGDLARWLPDGNIDFIGRIDHQVKIRGFRIELGEIETQLRKYPNLKEVAVVDKKDENGNKYLCGYIVSEKEISSKELKEFLKKELPNYMIPSHIIQLENMPINCNGKIDRGLLPTPDSSQRDVEFIEPRNNIEKKLAYMWCDIFNIKKVSIEDNFFDLGGHSLNSISLASKIYKEFNVKINISDIFDKPSIKELGEYLAYISLTANKSEHKEIEKAPKLEYYEASAVQKRMYAVNQTDINSTNYNMPFVYLIKGSFNIKLFKEALYKLVNKHEALRTSFHVINGQIVQRIHDSVELNVESLKINKVFDLSGFEVNEVVKPFNLSKSPLIRVSIIEFDDLNMLIMDMHHIISDGFSAGIITRELSALYNKEKIEEVKIQYKDFSNWQNNLYKNGELVSEEKYWNDKLKGEITTVNIPWDYKRSNQQDFEGCTINFEIDESVTDKVDEIINDLCITKFMFYVAAYNVLLYKYTGQKDLIIGVPASGRTHEGLQNTVGMFVNTLPLRNKIEKGISFRQFLNVVKVNSLKAFENQNYDLKNIFEKLNIKKTSVFDMIFSFQNVDINMLDFKDTEISNYKIKSNIAKFNVSMILEEQDGKILGSVEYKKSLYTKEKMEKFTNHFINIIKDIVKSLDNSVDDIDILLEDEKDLILNKFNDIKKIYPCTKTIKEVFEEMLVNVEAKVAVVSNGKHITFKELNEKANQLACLLRKKGVKANNIVPIICDRSIETLVGMLAIIKSGGAYLPIDEEYPKSRIKYMIEDSKSKILMIKSKHLNKFALDKLNIECINLSAKEAFKEETKNLENITLPNDLAYVIYTSGSTGNPKGVRIKNRSLINLIKNFDYLKIDKDDRMLQSGSLSFDVSVFQIWISLLSGIPLYLEENTLLIDNAALENYIYENKITIMFAPTPLFNQYSQNNIEIFKNLKYLMVGGDVLLGKLLSKITKVHKNLKIINAYGPTENTVISTVYEVKGKWDENVTVPIGHPVPNSTAYIMDTNSKLLPIGIAGELCVGGDGVSTGYLNKEELTKEKFIENPYVKGEIIYKTGDLAKWLPNGNIEFIGRIDHQVKIRGFRIELGEIEAQLLKHPMLKEVAVIDKKEEGGNKYLCGYFVSEEEICANELKKFLKKELPSYMIPSYILRIEQMPINANGKIDRKLLPDPKLFTENDKFVGPRNKIEEKLSDIWCEIFNIKKVSVEDNFFELGGHSLNAIGLASKIYEIFRIKINVTHIFSKPTIEELAKYLSKVYGGFKEDNSFEHREIKKAPKLDYYEASSVQKRMYAINQIDVNSTNYNMPFAYIVEGKFDKVRFEKAILELINRHEAFRTSFHIVNGAIMQKIHEKIDFKAQCIKINENFDESKFNGYKFIKSFDLSKAPLIDTSIIEFNDVSMIIINIHHIVCDGVSMGVIIKELSSLYNGEKVDKVKMQYKDFTNWQNQSLQRELFKNQEQYWIHKLKGELPALNMPSDFKASNKQNFEGDTIRFEIDESISNQVESTINKLGITKFMFYTAVYNVLLYKYTGQKDLIIGTPVVGRTQEEIKDTVGMFVNTLPLRSKLEDNMNFKEFLNQVKLNLLEIFENQDYDLKNIIEKLNINTTSLFDVSFSFENLDGTMLDFKNVQLQTYEIKNNISKFNISMILKEDNGSVLGALEYKKALYTKEKMENFIRHYKNILKEVLENIYISISNIDILSEKEKYLILNKFNNTKCAYPDDITVKELFEETVIKAQNKIAIVSNGREVTFKELNKKANQLAHLLRRKGATTDDIIPIICDRSIETIIAMIAVIKAGAAYLPIDEDYPEERLKYILKDCNCKIVIGRHKHFNKFKLCELKLNLVEFNDKKALEESLYNLDNIAGCENLAYVIYTSGSTGNPKGVCVENKSLIKIIKNTNYYKIDNEDKILQSGSLSFDASVQQIWITLLNGIAIHIEEKNLILDFELLEKYVMENKITFLILPTVLFNKLAEERIMVLENIKYVIAGGDVISSKQVSRITSMYKDITIVNGYGPTENTIISTAFKVKGEWNEEKLLPIGKPISNSTAYIMDKNNKLLPVGVPGELCVGGEGLSRGYLNNNQLTEEKFIENPYVKGERIYKTGDIAKWLDDGNIEFIGRVDHQVKIRGFRIELGEIENALLKHDEVREAAVIDKADEHGNKYLCAYIVVKSEVSINELREFLKKEVPGYMIPSYMMQIESMPTTDNGKLDRRALLKVELIKENSEYKAPNNYVEEKISMIWSEVLGIKNIGVDSNFFDIGGNSLKAISVVSKLSKEFHISINHIFKYPTIQELAISIKNKKENKQLEEKYVKDMVAATKVSEEYNEVNIIPKEIKPKYDMYISEIEKYKNLDLNSDAKYGDVLLTGATGYVGIYILKELLINTDSTIHLLLRGKTIREAEERLIQKTKFYFEESFYDKYKHRINILIGDICSDYLGLNKDTYEKLSFKIDCIINSAANVKHYGKYEGFYKTNILGTKQLLHFATKGVKKDFNQISTISVASGNIFNTRLVMFSEDNIDVNQKCDNLYVRSKLEAEKLVSEASKVLNTKIFRVGNVTFNYETGTFQENISENAFYQNLRSFIKLNCAPDIKGKILDFCFVDQLTKAIVLIFNKKNLNKQIFHIENPNKLSIKDLVDKLKIKYNIELKSMTDFESYVFSKSEDKGLKEYVENVMVHLGLLENKQSTTFVTVSEKTNFILNRLGFKWNDLDEKSLKNMIKYCKMVDFL